MLSRTSVLAGLVLAGALAGPAVAGAGDAAERKARAADDAAARRVPDGSAPKAWVAMVVTRITRAGRETGGPKGRVTIRVRIGIDGALEGAAVEETSGSVTLDERALKAVRAAAPFSPPPRSLLTLEGFTELSFPLDLDKTAAR